MAFIFMPEENDIIEETPEVAEPVEETTDVEPTETEADPEPAADDVDDAVESDRSIDDIWDALDFTAKLAESSDDIEETDDAEGEEPAFPSENEDADADIAEPEDLTDDELLDLDLEKPAPLSRRKAEKVVKGVIEPFRDPATPIEDVLSALAEFHPTRTQELAEAIVAESVKSFPEEWLKSITGVDVTVEQVKQWAETGGSSPANTAPTAANVQSDSAEMKQLVDELTELYGEDWRDPNKDHDLLDADRAVVLAVRSHLAKDQAYADLQQQLEETKSQLSDIKPQVDTIANTQNAELEQAIMSSYASEVEAYRQKVESSSIPKILEAKGMVAKESDSPEVKAAKELLASRFQPIEGYGSDFDIFLEKQFSGKESMTKAMKRVGNYLAEATRLEVSANRNPNANEAQLDRQKAAALKEQAALEQDALTVWTRKAATEFLDTPFVKPILSILEQNAELQRRLNALGRPEIIGQTAAIGGETGWRAKVQEAKRAGTNPFDLDISEMLSGR